MTSSGRDTATVLSGSNFANQTNLQESSTIDSQQIQSIASDGSMVCARGSYGEETACPWWGDKLIILPGPNPSMANCVVIK